MATTSKKRAKGRITKTLRKKFLRVARKRATLPCGHVDPEGVFLNGYYDGLRDGRFAGMKAAVETLLTRVDQASGDLTRTPIGDPRRADAEKRLTAAISLVQSISRDWRGELREELREGVRAGRTLAFRSPFANVV